MAVGETLATGGTRDEHRRVAVVGLKLSTLGLAASAEQVLAWAVAGEARSVCAANVHMVMEGHDDRAFQGLVNGADMVTPDGMPLVWALRGLGQAGAERVYGPDLMLEVCRLASLRGVAIGLYGGREDVLAALRRNLCRQFPELQIPYAYSPPFRSLEPEEQVQVQAEIRASGVPILFVGLGCPKQERWVAEQRGRGAGVLLAVGAAFDFHAGTLPQAPSWMQRAGLEWLFRLVQEPGRLWKRYLKHNPRFVWLFGCQLLGRLLGLSRASIATD